MTEGGRCPGNLGERTVSPVGLECPEGCACDAAFPRKVGRFDEGGLEHFKAGEGYP